MIDYVRMTITLQSKERCHSIRFSEDDIDCLLEALYQYDNRNSRELFGVIKFFYDSVKEKEE